MKPNSLVVYVGGQCEFGKSVAPLKLNKVYTVYSVANELYDDGTIGRPVIYLDEMMYIREDVQNRPYAFVQHMFREIDPPREINLEEIIKIHQS